MVPSTAVMLREGSFALAFFGRVRNIQEQAFSLSAGRKSFALKQILEAVLIISTWYHSATLAWQMRMNSKTRKNLLKLATAVTFNLLLSGFVASE